MRRNSDGGDAASSDSTRRRQEVSSAHAGWESKVLTVCISCSLSGSKLICGAVLMMVTLLLVIGKDKK